VDEIFAEFDYNANGLMTLVKRCEVDGNNLINEIAESLYTYNANNAVTSITHKNPDETQIVQHSYTYDETNNIVEYLNSIDGQTSYDYDFLGQLIGADYANQNLDDETYTYDENGNRITANGSNYTTGDNNELTSDGTWTYTYDAEGNRISKTNAANTERELYTWDYRNRLTTATKQTYDTLTNEWTTVQIVEYSYDYNNVWIRKTVGNNSTIFIPENYQTTVQIDNNTVTHHYLWTPNQQDKLLADTTSTDVLWSLTDHLGTIRDVLSDTTTHLIYDAFGNLTSGTNPLLFGYTGKAFDTATNLQNNINRWYDSTVGKWLSIDPIGFEGDDTNLYRYVKNSSIQFVDTYGYSACGFESSLVHLRDKNWDKKTYFIAEVEATVKLSSLMKTKGAISLAASFQKQHEKITAKQYEQAYKTFLPEKYSFSMPINNLPPNWDELARNGNVYPVLDKIKQFYPPNSIIKNWKKIFTKTYYYNFRIESQGGVDKITGIVPVKVGIALKASLVITINASVAIDAKVAKWELYHIHCGGK